MFLPLKKILPRKIGSWNLNQYFLERELRRAWQAVAASHYGTMFKDSKPLYFRNGVYFIGCDNSCQANELRFQGRELCQIINQILKRPMVKQIQFLSY